ncbi:MAG: peptidylprolyl isomerase [Eubacterium sp.]|nr:peptidylprolyl isomerase [Eubacterium sp.]
MAKEEIKNEGKEKLTKEEKQANKLAAKKEKAEAKKAELREQIDELKTKIVDENDEKVKEKLRAQRDDLAAQLDGIKKSKDGMTIPMAPITKKRIKACIAIVVVIGLLCAYLFTGTARYGLLSYFGVPQSTLTAYTITDGDGEKHSVKVSTYNYYYALYYNNLRSQQEQYAQYGIDLGDDKQVDFDKKLKDQTTTNDDGDTITWAQYMREEIMENIKSTYTYYYEAVKNNKGKEPKITDDQKKELKETLDSYEETAKGYGFTVSGYLTAAMGKGVTEEVFKREARISYIADNYKEEYQKELNSKEYSNNDYNKYREEHESELQVVDLKYFECDTEDDAKAFVKALKKDGSNFAELASKYTSEDNAFDKEANKNDVETTYKEITRSTLQSLGAAIAQADATESTEETEAENKTYSGLDWIYSADRKAGDVKQVSTSVVYMLKKARISDTKTVTVRHILINPLTEEEQNDNKSPSTDATADQWKEAKKKAESILAEYNKGDKTAEAFGELAKTNSTDSNAEDGGIYENVTPNQMVPTFNAWCFDSSRKAGDTGIVKTEFGYHIIYFESYGDLPVWKYTAQQALASDDGTKAQEKLEKSYKIEENWFGSLFFEIDTDIDS